MIFALLQMQETNKIRLDNLLLELGFFDSREKARTCIMSNGVHIASKLENKAGKQINLKKFYEAFDQDPNYIKVEDKLMPYVSRGAFKLEAAFKEFSLDFSNKKILDIGASTGGFIDFALQHGAASAIALDVGFGQLHYKLQEDSRVLNLEKTNFRTWNGGVDESFLPLDMVVTDVSFISLITILEKLKELYLESNIFTKEDLLAIVLLKPQFEAGKEIMDKCQGVIKDEKIRNEVCQKAKEKITELGFKILCETQSPIKGAKGNLEDLLMLKLVK